MTTIRKIAVTALLTVFLPDILDSQWMPTNGPYGAYVATLVARPGASGTDLLLGTFYGGAVFLSTNGGSHWTVIGAGLTDTNVTAITTMGTDLFVGTRSGVLRSSNSGTNWTQVNSGLTSIDIFALFVKDQNLFAGTSEGVFLSTDSASSWTRADSGLPGGLLATGFVQMDTSVFAATSQGVFRSEDNGIHWDTAGTPPTGSRCLAASDSILFAGGGAGVSRSTDHGRSWTKADSGITTKYVWSLAVIPDGNRGVNLFAGTWGGGVFRSADLGTNWTAVNNELVDHDVRALAVVPNDTAAKIYAGTWGSGVFSSTDNGASWNAFSNGLNPLGIWDLAVDGQNLFVVSNKFNTGVYRSSDNGDHWVQLGNLYTNWRFYSIAVLRSSILAGAYADLFYSRDGGATWTPSSTSFKDITVFSFAATDSFFFAGTDGGIYRSADSGETWTPLHAGGSLVIAIPRSTNPNGKDSTYLFTNSSDGLQRSSDNGLQWTAATNGLGIYNNITSLAACDTLLFAASQGVAPLFRSTDYGETWTQINTGLSDANYRGLAVSGHNIFAGTLDHGIIHSSDLGLTWSQVNTGLTNTGAQPLAANDTYLFAVSGKTVWYDGIVWRRPLSEMIVPVSVASADLPAVFALEQNYPNPFNPVTTLKYTVGVAGGQWQVASGAGAGEAGGRIRGPGARKTRLIVYDVLGRQVATLVDEVKAPGSYEVRFDGGGLASGVYVYRLTAGSFVQSRKMVLLK